jgi:hypothetical protein
MEVEPKTPAVLPFVKIVIQVALLCVTAGMVLLLVLLVNRMMSSQSCLGFNSQLTSQSSLLMWNWVSEWLEQVKFRL